MSLYLIDLDAMCSGWMLQGVSAASAFHLFSSLQKHFGGGEHSTVVKSKTNWTKVQKCDSSLVVERLKTQ